MKALTFKGFLGDDEVGGGDDGDDNDDGGGGGSVLGGKGLYGGVEGLTSESWLGM